MKRGATCSNFCSLFEIRNLCQRKKWMKLFRQKIARQNVLVGSRFDGAKLFRQLAILLNSAKPSLYRSPSLTTLSVLSVWRSTKLKKWRGSKVCLVSQNLHQVEHEFCKRNRCCRHQSSYFSNCIFPIRKETAKNTRPFVSTMFS